MSGSPSKVLTKQLFKAVDPTAPTFIDVPLGPLAECSRHQLVVTVKPDPSAGSVAVRGILKGSGLPAAKFDLRLDAINMALGSQMFTFYGLFDGLRFDFSGFAAGKKLSAALVSHEAELLASGNSP